MVVVTVLAGRADEVECLLHSSVGMMDENPSLASVVRDNFVLPLRKTNKDEKPTDDLYHKQINAGSRGSFEMQGSILVVVSFI